MIMERFNTIVYLNSGAIGEFLMTLYLADGVEQSARANGVPVPRVYIIVQRNHAFLSELAHEYPHVHVVPLARRSALRAILEVRRGPLPRIVLTQQTFGRLPFLLKIVARLMALGPRTVLAGYDDGYALNRLLYDRLWQFDYSALFPKEMCRLAERCGYGGACPQPFLRWKSVPPQTREKYVVLHLRSQIPERSWSIARWKEFITRLRAAHPDRHFIFTGTLADRPFIDAAIGEASDCENCAGELSVDELISTIDRAALFIGVDTGITHLAAFRGAPLVIIGNNTNPIWWATYDPKCIWLVDLTRCTCDGRKGGKCGEVDADGVKRPYCLSDISDEQVLRAVASKISEHA